MKKNAPRTGQYFQRLIEGSCLDVVVMSAWSKRYLHVLFDFVLGIAGIWHRNVSDMIVFQNFGRTIFAHHWALSESNNFNKRSCGLEYGVLESAIVFQFPVAEYLSYLSQILVRVSFEQDQSYFLFHTMEMYSATRVQLNFPDPQVSHSFLWGERCLPANAVSVTPQYQ